MEKLKLEFNSDVSLEEQKVAGIKYLRMHCLDFIETAKIERQVRMKHARDVYLEGVRLHEQEELQRRKEEEERLAKIEEESRCAAEARLREKEEEEEEVRSDDWPVHTRARVPSQVKVLILHAVPPSPDSVHIFIK